MAATSANTQYFAGTPTAAPPSFRVPGEIPPRKSSASPAASAAAAQYGSAPPVPLWSKNVLRAVAEGDWLAGAKTGHVTSGTVRHTLPDTHKRLPSHSKKASVSSLPPPPLTSSFSTIAMASPPPPPAADANRFATDDFIFGSKRAWSEEKERVLMGPFEYLEHHPGKDFRTQMIKAFDAWLEVPPESLQVITRVVGMLHTASLLVDDVEDSSTLRRGLPVAHHIFGVPQVINSANYVYFAALQELQRLRSPQAVAIFADELVHLHRGQGMDLFWRDTLTCPSEDEYLEMVANKTGGLFRLAVKLMQAESRSELDCVPLVDVLGLVFQIQDDYRNLRSAQYSDNKGICEDLTEGKFSFPIIHSLRADPADRQLLSILKQRTDDAHVKQYAVKYMERTGSFDYTRRVIEVLIARARRIIDELDKGDGRGAGIHKILDRLVVSD